MRNMQHRWIELTPIRFFGAEEDEDKDELNPDPQAGAEDDDADDDDGDKVSPEVVKLRRENAARRIKAKEATDRADKAEAALAKIKKAEMSDLEAAQTELETASTDLETAKAGETSALALLKTERIRNAVTMAAVEAKFVDPTDALSMISQDDLVDDEGNIVTGTVTKRLQALAKKKPYLLKSHRPGSGDGGGTGKPGDTDSFEGRKAAHLKEMTTTGGRVQVGG